MRCEWNLDRRRTGIAPDVENWRIPNKLLGLHKNPRHAGVQGEMWGGALSSSVWNLSTKGNDSSALCFYSLCIPTPRRCHIQSVELHTAVHQPVVHMQLTDINSRIYGLGHFALLIAQKEREHFLLLVICTLCVLSILLPKNYIAVN